MRKAHAYLAYGEDGIYSPGSIMTLAIYETKEHAKQDGWGDNEIAKCTIIYRTKKSNH